jgi:hypothetical protein
VRARWATGWSRFYVETGHYEAVPIAGQCRRGRPRRLKPLLILRQYGTTEVVPFQSKFKLTRYRYSCQSFQALSFALQSQ